MKTPTDDLEARRTGAFGRRKAAPAASSTKAAENERRQWERRKGDRRKKGRRANELGDLGNLDRPLSYRERAQILRVLAKVERQSERRRVLLKIAQDYEHLSETLDAIDRTESSTESDI